MEIRTLDKNLDLAAFREIRVESAQNSPETFRATVEDMKSKTVQDFQEHISGAQEGDFIVGAFVEGELVGVAALYHESYEKLSHKVTIGSLYVKPQHRKIGIATKLIDEVVQRVKDSGGIRLINLSVITTNISAVRLYEKLGFVTYGNEPNSVYVNGTYYDEQFLQLVI